jgi:hypothetical protein
VCLIDRGCTEGIHDGILSGESFNSHSTAARRQQRGRGKSPDGLARAREASGQHHLQMIEFAVISNGVVPGAESRVPSRALEM